MKTAMVTLSETNKIRLQAVVFLVAAHIFIIMFWTAERQLKISLSSLTLFATALFIVIRGRALRRKKEIEELI